MILIETEEEDIMAKEIHVDTTMIEKWQKASKIHPLIPTNACSYMCAR